MFELDRESGVPLPAQIAAHFRGLIAEGVMRAYDRMPSSRVLAQTLGVSRGSAVAAYDQLVAEGYLVTRAKGATYVHPDALEARKISFIRSVGEDSPMVANESRARVKGASGTSGENEGEVRANAHTTRNNPAIQDSRAERGGAFASALGGPNVSASVRIIDLRPGITNENVGEDSAWREAWRSAAGAQNEGVIDTRGDRQLREAIAEHLRLTRAMTVDPGSIIVTAGARDGLFTLLGCLPELGFRPALAVEEPGYPGLRGVIRRSGLQMLAMGREIPAEAGAAVVTPNRLYPLGGSMPAGQRLDLIRAAEHRGVLVIEDDLDSQDRHTGPLMPSLWELAPDRVAHLGTFNRVLTNEVRLGYLILAPNLQQPLLDLRQDLGLTPSAIAQRAVATYLGHGGLRRQIVRHRRDLARRKATVRDILASLDVQLHAESTAIVRLARELERDVVVGCEQRGVSVGSLSSYWSGGAEGGIVFSYGQVAGSELEAALWTIAEVVGEGFRADGHEGA
ncbi:MAG: PLP-dependent aminotransferase family protein [Ancrocorticia sp.]